MVLMRTGNWWLPGWLDQVLPRISIEGEEYFAQSPATRKPEPSASLKPSS